MSRKDRESETEGEDRRTKRQKETGERDRQERQQERKSGKGGEGKGSRKMVKTNPKPQRALVACKCPAAGGSPPWPEPGEGLRSRGAWGQRGPSHSLEDTLGDVMSPGLLWGWGFCP